MSPSLWSPLSWPYSFFSNTFKLHRKRNGFCLLFSMVYGVCASKTYLCSICGFVFFSGSPSLIWKTGCAVEKLDRRQYFLPIWKPFSYVYSLLFFLLLISFSIFSVQFVRKVIRSIYSIPIFSTCIVYSIYQSFSPHACSTTDFYPNDIPWIATFLHSHIIIVTDGPRFFSRFSFVVLHAYNCRIHTRRRFYCIHCAQCSSAHWVALSIFYSTFNVHCCTIIHTFDLAI